MKKIVGMFIGFVITLAIFGGATQGLSVEPSAFPYNSSAWRLADFHERLTAYLVSSPEPQAVMVGPCYGYDIAEGTSIVNLCMAGQYPSEAAHIVSHFARPSDKVLWAVTYRDLHKYPTPRLEIVNAGFRRFTLAVFRLKGLLGVLDDSQMSPPPASAEELRYVQQFVPGLPPSSYPWVVDELRNTTTVGESALLSAAYRAHPNMQIVICPMLRPIESGPLHAHIDDARNIFSQYPHIDLSATVPTPLFTSLNHISIEGSRLVQQHLAVELSL